MHKSHKFHANNKFDLLSFCLLSILIALASFFVIRSTLARISPAADISIIARTPSIIDSVPTKATISQKKPDTTVLEVTPKINNRINIAPTLKPALSKPSTFMLNDAYSFRQDNIDWGYDPIGKTSQALFNFGCTITSVAMAASNLMQTKITPGEMEDRLEKYDGFTNTGLLIWNRLEPATNGRVHAIINANPSHTTIRNCAAQNGYPIIKIRLASGFIHWVIIVGHSGQDYLIRDPLVGEPSNDPIFLSQRSDNIYAMRCLVLRE